MTINVMRGKLQPPPPPPNPPLETETFQFKSGEYQREMG